MSGRRAASERLSFGTSSVARAGERRTLPAMRTIKSALFSVLLVAACGDSKGTSDSDSGASSGGASTDGPTSTGGGTGSTGGSTTGGTGDGTSGVTDATSETTPTDSTPTTLEATTEVVTTDAETDSTAGGSTTTGETGDGTGETGVQLLVDGSAESTCAPNDGPAVELKIDLSAPVCGASWDGEQLRVIVFQGAPLAPGTYMLGDDTGFGTLQIGANEPMFADAGSVTIESWTDAEVTGTYTVIFGDNTMRSGAFTGPFCPTMPMCG